jgi:hypothetical protein
VNEYIELFSFQLSQIEQLARRLLQRKFESAQDLWEIQKDLARCQTSILKEIKNQNFIKNRFDNKIANIAKSREKGWQKIIQDFQKELEKIKVRVAIYRHAHMMAKQLGDTIAWLFLKGDEKKIASLSTNAPNPPIDTGVGLQGMLAIAETFANAGAGFPLIHDLTNCLTVGDLTFVNVLDKKDEPLTVEVKTKAESVKDGIAHLKVSIYAIAESMKFVTAMNKLQNVPIELQKNNTSVEQGKECSKIVNRPKRESNDRLLRQIDRMAFAKAYQAAEYEESIETLGRKPLPMPVIPVKLMVKHSYFHWDIICQMVEIAKKNGYATRVVEDAFFYVVTYTDLPSVYPWSSNVNLDFMEQIKEDCKNNLPVCADTNKNQIVFGTTWDYLYGNVPLHIRPFFLYEFPIDLRMDIMWRRLTIMVFINLGKLAEALECVDGLSARAPRDKKEFRNYFIPITYKETLANGSVVSIHAGNLKKVADKSLFEFMSVEGFVESVCQCIAAMLRVAKTSGYSHKPGEALPVL